MTSPRRARRGVAVLVCLLTALAVLGPLAAAGPAVAAEKWTPTDGVRISNPLGDFDQRRAVLGHLIRSIDNTPRRGKIRVASWNVRSDDVVDALVAAHRRGASVRVVLDRGNANPGNPNDGVQRLKFHLRHHGNAARPAMMRSGVRKCRTACRGDAGIAHAKFFLFSKVGRARWVVINSSANATDLAASSQWNDASTVTGNRTLHRAFHRMYRQMWRRKTVAQGYLSASAAPYRATFYPYVGASTGTDPVMRELKKVQCTDAKAFADGRTRIRVAMTAWHGDRGEQIAWKLRRLANAGCRVKIVYAVAGNEVLRILRREGRRPVPLRQIVQDPNGDGVYDRYLHTKVLTIAGHYRGSRGAFVTINGSGNWTPVSLASDEAVLRVRSKAVVKQYNAFVQHLYRNPPPMPPTFGRGLVGPPSRVSDPYALVEVN